MTPRSRELRERAPLPLYAPTGVLAQELRRAPRGAAVLDTARSALGVRISVPGQRNQTLHDIVVESDGSVRSLNVSGRDFGAKYALHRLGGRGKRGDILLPMDAAFPTDFDGRRSQPCMYRGSLSWTLF